MIQQAFDFTRPAPPTRQNLVIEAGAGTGKTTAIVAEVLRLMIEREDLAAERVVLMTFTEKAAGEIADRIRAALEELVASGASAWPIGSPSPLLTLDPARAKRAFERHLEDIDAIRSQTIHSFCQSLLRIFPIEAGLDPQFKIIEGFERSLLYSQIYDAWLDEETRVNPEEERVAEWELLFAHAGYLFQIRDLILNLLNRRDLIEEEGGDWGDFERDVEGKLTDALLWIRRDRATCKDPAAARVAQYVRETPFEGGQMDAWIAYFQPIAASIRDVKLPGCGPLKEPMVVLRSGAPGDSIYDRLIGHRAAMALLALTRRFLAFLGAEKRKLGVVDFDDLLLRTLAVLDHPDVLERARAQFDFIFVDEFQDTDRTQARIIDRLARDASGRFVPGKTIVVGDPKQSIYGFRRADPETYHLTTEALRAQGAELRLLRDQFRSDPALVDAVNAMFARLFPEQAHDPNVFRPAYHDLRAARTQPRRELDARVTLLLADHEEKADRWTAEAESIAEWILANSDGDLRRFAILFRRSTKLDDYLDVFDRCDIPYVLPPTRMFLDRRAPVDLLAVLRAIAYPFDRGAQISAARTPYFALTDEEIANGILECGGDAAAFQSFSASIERFREASRHLTVSALIDLVATTCAIERVYEAAADGIRHLRHLEHVRAIAFEYDQRIGGSVRQFIDEIARRRSEPDEMEPTIDESQNAVRILTVHAAKGLEFETVILPDLVFPTGSSESGLQLFTVREPAPYLVLSGRAETISANFIHTAGGEPLEKIASQREEAEARRLFYVAVTRAMTDVVFVCALGEGTATMGFFKCLTEALGVDRKALPSLWTNGREVKDTIIGPVAFERVDRRDRLSSTRRRLHDAALERELATSEIVPVEIPVPEPVSEPLTSGEIAARRAGSRNKATGILLHRVLELWDGRADVEPLLTRLAVEAAADADAVLRVRRRLATVARSEAMLRIARAETVGREVPIRFRENGALVERRIDRLLRENGAEVVIDYKSGKAEELRAAKDREQVARYCRAVSDMTGRPCKGLLWYIDVENDLLVEVE